MPSPSLSLRIAVRACLLIIHTQFGWNTSGTMSCASISSSAVITVEAAVVTT
uniref:Uncharacterized protein n=1 Tax=Siphoviridae sp. ctd9R8 TaxID=2825576 RepID=A0A8S5PWD2_9CAUD|nr:MAG TPA: hypothetical protein [Siphoviridae sp. ctd9R8]